MNFHEKVTGFIRELKRRKVFQVGSVYLVTAWGACLGAAELLPAFGVPDWGVRMFVIVTALGFPVAVALAWVYEFSAEGIRVDPPAPGRTPQSDRSATTRLASSEASVRVNWTDDEGKHSQSFGNSFVIGRDSSCDIDLDDPMISRRHARVFVENGNWHIEDLGSRNGTRLDGQLIDRAPLPSRSEVVLYPDGPAFEVEVRGQLGETVAFVRTG